MEQRDFSDEFGPELIYRTYDPKTGMKGITVVDNTALGPAKGGIRMTSTVNVEEVFRLARTMTWKNSLADLPFGGGKSGIIANVGTMKRDKKKQVVQAFGRALRPIAPSKYIAAPDIHMGEEEVKWFVDANGNFKSATGKPANMCVKPGEKCGIPHEYGSTGYGVSIAALMAANKLLMDPKKMTLAIEGFGNVGSFVAKYMQQAGVKIIAASDSHGCIYKPEGLTFKELTEAKKKSGTVTKVKGGKILPNGKVFEVPCDMLIPAALPDVVTKSNVNKIKAKIIVEGSNIPMKANIEEELHKKGKLVVPDFLANAGGVISSYAEYRGKNPTDMFKIVKRKMEKNVKNVLSRAEKDNVKPRNAGLIIAKERVVKAMKKRKE